MNPFCLGRSTHEYTTGKGTLHTTNSSPLKIGFPKRRVVCQPCIFRGDVLVSVRG